MKKLIIITLISLFLLFTSLWVYVQSDAFAKQIRPLVAKPLQEVLGPEAKIGWVKANLLPLYLEIRDVSIPSGSDEAIGVRKVKIYLNPFPLVIKRVSLPSIVLLEPRIAAERTAQGDINLASLVKKIKENIAKMRASGPPGFRVQVRTVTVRNGRAAYRDRGASTTIIASRIAMKAKVSLAAARMDLRITSADVAVVFAAYPEFVCRLRAVAGYDQGKIRIQSFDAASGDARLTASGSIGLAPGGDLDLRLTTRFGARALARYADVLKKDARQRKASLEASAVVRGKMDAPVVEGSVALNNVPYRGMMVKEAALKFIYRDKALTATGKRWILVKGNSRSAVEDAALEFAYREAGVDVKRFDVRAEDLELRLTGRAEPEKGLDLRVAAESSGAGRTLSFLLGTDVNGKVSVEGTLGGAFSEPVFDGLLAAGPVTVRGTVFNRVSGRVAYHDRKVSFIETAIQQQGSRYVFDGSVDLGGAEPLYHARLKVIKSDVVSIVALFYRRIPLDLSASGELLFNGTRRDFSGEGRLDLESGTAYGEPFDRGSVSASLTNNRISFPSVVLMRQGGALKGSGWIGFDGTYTAHIEGRGLEISGISHLSGLGLSGLFELDLRSSGTFSDPRLSATLDVDQLSYRQTALGRTEAEAEISNGQLALTGSIDDDAFTVNGKMQLKAPYSWALSAEVHTEAAQPPQIFGNSELLAKVRLTADGSLSVYGNGSDLSTLTGAALFQRLALSLADYRMENEGDCDFRIEAGRLVVRSLRFAGQGTKLAVSGSAAVLKDLDLIFTGDANLSLLRLFYKEVEHGDGTAEVKLTVRDEWSNPDVAGELRIRDGLVKLNDIPQRFTALNGAISFDRSRIVTEGLTGEAGGGTITVSGFAQLDGLSLKDFSTKAAIENVTVRYPAGLTATLAGDLYYDGDASEQTLSGDITVRRARYEKRVEWKSMLVDFTKGFTPRKKADIGWIGETRLNVRFHGQDNIVFQSNLAKIPLDIDMFFRGTVNQLQVLGRIEARKGEVYFRKNVFKILHASADFFDPHRINPTLDVQAQTRVREYDIRLAVTGTADRAVVTFLSDPPLTDSNILALLALGRTGEELKGKEAGVGVGEATSFATGKFQDILESRARSLTGLDRFQVDPYISKTDVSVPRVTVGKEVVQDKLFVTYSSNVGGATPEQLFRIEYMLDKHISLVGERNETGNIGADVKFRFEFR